MERRKHERVPLAVPIRIRIDDIDRFALQHSLDLSAGGIFVQTNRVYAPGTEVDLQFYFRRQKTKIPAKGIVIRSGPGGEMGDGEFGVAIKFTQLSVGAKRFIEQAILKWNLHHPSQVLDLPEDIFEGDREAQPATERGMQPPINDDFDI